MIQVNDVADIKGRWVNDEVLVLEAPRFNTAEQRWEALANAYGMLAIIELRVTEGKGEG